MLATALRQKGVGLLKWWTSSGIRAMILRGNPLYWDGSNIGFVEKGVISTSRERVS